MLQLAAPCIAALVVLAATVTIGLSSVSEAATLIPTVTALTSSAPAVTVGQPFTLTAQVTVSSPPAAQVPTGTVTFEDSGGPICSTVPLSTVYPATATCTTFSEVVGINSPITAVYNGSTTYATSTSNGVSENVSAGPAPSLSPSESPVPVGAVGVGVLGNLVAVTLTNNGSGYDAVDGMDFTGADPNDFYGASDCFTGDGTPADDTSSSIPSGGTCTVEVGGAPNVTGARTATLVIYLNNGAGTLSIPVSGSGVDGYQEVTSAGKVFNFGDAVSAGDLSTTSLKKPVVGMAETPDGQGYWLVASDGGIFSYGDAQFYGSTGDLNLNKPIVGMAATPDGGGYWLVASDGGIFSYGDALFSGSTGALHLNKPIVGMATTPDGGGYWLVASDGGIFSFGDAQFYGSTGGMTLNQPIVGMATTPDGGGYWLVASDGGIFAFGDAQFYGSTGAMKLNKPIVGMAASPLGDGYHLVASDGGIFSFGDAGFYGSAATAGLSNIVGMVDTSPPDQAQYLGVFGTGPGSLGGSVLHSRQAAERALAKAAGARQ
jgi:hypothetical protein